MIIMLYAAHNKQEDDKMGDQSEKKIFSITTSARIILLSTAS